MNYLPILLKGFTYENTAGVSIFTKNVIAMMTDNPNFPSLKKQVAELANIYDVFLQSILPPESQNKISRDILKMNRQKLNLQLKSLANLIMGEAKGDIEKLLTSGYKLREKSTPRPVPATPTNVEIMVTNTEGVVVVSCQKVNYAVNYIARISLDKVNWNWLNFENGTKVMLENVPTNQLIYVQMQTKNSAGRSLWSKIVEAYVPSQDIPTIKKINISNSMA